jgi:hypothetical protein
MAESNYYHQHLAKQKYRLMNPGRETAVSVVSPVQDDIRRARVRVSRNKRSLSVRGRPRRSVGLRKNNKSRSSFGRVSRRSVKKKKPKSTYIRRRRTVKTKKKNSKSPRGGKKRPSKTNRRGRK